MKILLDTHYLLWSFIDPGKMSESVKEMLIAEGNDIYYSQVSLWELSIKIRLGKLSLSGISPEQFYEHVRSSHFLCRTLDNEELISFYKLPVEHKDPFDRLMIWQAINSNCFFLSVDREVKSYCKYGLRLLNA